MYKRHVLIGFMLIADDASLKSWSVFLKFVFSSIDQSQKDKIIIIDKDNSGCSTLEINIADVCPFCCTFYRNENFNKNNFGLAANGVFHEFIQYFTEANCSIYVEKLIPKAYVYILGGVRE